MTNKVDSSTQTDEKIYRDYIDKLIYQKIEEEKTKEQIAYQKCIEFLKSIGEYR